MTSHSSAMTREHTPHANQTTRTATIIDALTRRAEAVLNDESIDPQSRTIIRYALETNDPSLAELLRRADAGERIVDADERIRAVDFSEAPHADKVESGTKNSEVGPTDDPQEQPPSRDKLEVLADIICGAGEESAGALLVLMGQMEKSSYPEAIVHTVKHFAFTRCGELNLRGMVDTQIEMLESELFGSSRWSESAFATEMES